MRQNARRTSAPRSKVSSEGEEVSETRTMFLGTAEQTLRGVHAAEIEGQVVLPRVADSAVHLDAVLGYLARGVPGARFRDGSCPRRIRVISVEAHGRPVRRRPRPLEFHEVVRALVLNRLKAADRYAE